MSAADLGPNAQLRGVAGSRRRLSTPALLLDVDAMDRNIRRMAEFARSAGVGLRPHTKGGKSVAIARRQVEAGAVGICCTTVGEAEVMGGAGISDILVTSPVVTEEMIARLLLLNERIDGLAVAIDDPRNLEALARTVGDAKPLGVLVEYDVGQGRTGVADQDAHVALVREAAAAPQLRYRGIQAYYGHLQHIAKFADRRIEAQQQIARIRGLVDRLTNEGMRPEIVSGGGTGTFEIDAAAGIFTELQVGSYLFMDREYVEIEGGGGLTPGFEPSLFVMATVVNATRPGFVVVNAGYKSFATEGGPPVVRSPKLSGTSYKLMGDEHGGVSFDPKSGVLDLADAVEFLTPHCDPTINLYDRYHCVRGDTLVDIWPVDARGR
jgi:D-serine deaminase-like pyridoxal phosphate-dependent protein